MTDAVKQMQIDALRQRQTTYQAAAVAHPMVQEMLMDLAAYCKAGLSVAPEVDAEPLDKDRMLLLLGRQQVWLRISNHLNLQPSQLHALYSRRSFQVVEPDNATE